MPIPIPPSKSCIHALFYLLLTQQILGYAQLPGKHSHLHTGGCGHCPACVLSCGKQRLDLSCVSLLWDYYHKVGHIGNVSDAMECGTLKVIIPKIGTLMGVPLETYNSSPLLWLEVTSGAVHELLLLDPLECGNPPPPPLQRMLNSTKSHL